MSDSVSTWVVVVVTLVLALPAIWGFWQATRFGREMEKRIDDLQDEVDELRAKQRSDQHFISKLLDGIAQLMVQLRHADLEPVWKPDESTMYRPRPMAAVGLAKYIAQRFSIEELNQVIFELGMTRDQIGGETIEERARELVKWMGRNGRLSELRRKVYEHRPEGG